MIVTVFVPTYTRPIICGAFRAATPENLGSMLEALKTLAN